MAALESKWVEKWEVLGSSGDPYTVALHCDGFLGCSCPAWTRQRARLKNGMCKHIRKFLSHTQNMNELADAVVEHNIQMNDDFAAEVSPVWWNEIERRRRTSGVKVPQVVGLQDEESGSKMETLQRNAKWA